MRSLQKCTKNSYSKIEYTNKDYYTIEDNFSNIHYYIYSKLPFLESVSESTIYSFSSVLNQTVNMLPMPHFEKVGNYYNVLYSYSGKRKIEFELLTLEEFRNLVGEKKFSKSPFSPLFENSPSIVVFRLSLATYLKAYYSSQVFIGALLNQASLSAKKHKTLSNFYFAIPLPFSLSSRKIGLSLEFLDEFALRSINYAFIVGKSTIKRVYLRGSSNMRKSLKEIFEQASVTFKTSPTSTKPIKTLDLYDLYKGLLKKTNSKVTLNLRRDLHLFKLIAEDEETNSYEKVALLKFFFNLEKDKRPKAPPAFYTFYKKCKYLETDYTLISYYCNFFEEYSYRFMYVLDSFFQLETLTASEKVKALETYKRKFARFRKRYALNVVRYLERALQADRWFAEAKNGILKTKLTQFCLTAEMKPRILFFGSDETIEKLCGCWFCYLRRNYTRAFLKEVIKDNKLFVSCGGTELDLLRFVKLETDLDDFAFNLTKAMFGFKPPVIDEFVEQIYKSKEVIARAEDLRQEILTGFKKFIEGGVIEKNESYEN